MPAKTRPPQHQTAAPVDRLLGPPHAQATHNALDPMAQHAAMAPAHFMRGRRRGCAAAAAADQALGPARTIEAARTGPTAERTAMTRRTLRREGRVTVQGPVRGPTKDERHAGNVTEGVPPLDPPPLVLGMAEGLWHAMAFSADHTVISRPAPLE